MGYAKGLMFKIKDFSMPHIDLSLLLSLILLLIIASFSAHYANQKGRNPIAWFIIGTIIGIFAPLILFFLSDLKDLSGKKKMDRQ